MVLTKGLALLGVNVCASLYIGLGTYGSTLGQVPRLMDALSPWHSVLFGALAALLIRGIFYFGTMRDRIATREALDLKRREQRERRAWMKEYTRRRRATQRPLKSGAAPKP
jgi:hypothetical protein